MMEGLGRGEGREEDLRSDGYVNLTWEVISWRDWAEVKAVWKTFVQMAT